MRLPALQARAGALERRVSKESKNFVIVCLTPPSAAHAARAFDVATVLTRHKDRNHCRRSIRNPRHDIPPHPPVPPAILRDT